MQTQAIIQDTQAQPPALMERQEKVFWVSLYLLVPTIWAVPFLLIRIL